jgi:hypothetical protein
MLLVILCGVAARCASTSASGAAPSVTIAQTSAVDPVGVPSGQQTGVPVEYRLDVVNPLDHAITLTSVEMETVGSSGGYLMKRVRHSFAEVIPARGSAAIPVRAWVQPLQLSDTGRVSTPVLLRGSARFDSQEGTIKATFAASLKAVGPSR